jgi:peptidoglycan/LPS O-acetylase OafA/YrhL
MRRTMLFVDAAVNLALGVMLLLFSPELADFLGVPHSSTNFYPNILGAALFGIGIALVIAAVPKSGAPNRGLGLYGAISINLCGGVVLTLWLILGKLELPVKGLVFLWSLAAMLVVLSGAELIGGLRKRLRA